MANAFLNVKDTELKNSVFNNFNRCLKIKM